VEQPTHDALGVPGDDLALPVGEHDRRLVLAAGAVLREQARPVLPGRGGDQSACEEAGVDSTAGLHRAHRVRDLGVQAGVATVVEDVQGEDTSPAQ
jgi:hypothetical protein